MAIGRPRLATHFADGSIRLYELTSGVFVQVASTGSYPHVPNGSHPEGFVQKAKLFFGGDSQSLLFGYSPDGTSDVIVGFDSNLTQRALASNVLSGGIGALTAIPARGAVLGMRATSGVSYTSWVNTDFTTGNNVQGLTANPSYRGGAASPDGSSLALFGTKNTATLAGTAVTSSSVAYIINESQPNLSTGILFGAWLNNNYLVGGNDDLLCLYYMDLSSRELSETLLLEKIAGKPKRAAAVRTNGHWVAVAFENGSNVNTVIYEKRGTFPVKFQTLTNFGQALDFTQDGSMLIDAISKKAYSFSSSTWVDVSTTAMANIASGVDLQAVSTHIENPVGITRMYNNRLADLQVGLVNLDNLYITLLKPSAKAFTPTDNSFANVVGSDEVTGGFWPAGGIKIENVGATADGARNWMIDGSDVSWIFAGSSATVRYALIYDKTSMRPLLHIDFQQDQGIPSNMQATIQLGAGGLINYQS